MPNLIGRSDPLGYIAITLIICGTLLVAAPYIHYSIVMQQVAETMKELNTGVTLTSRVPGFVNVFSLIGGFTMIIVGALFGLYMMIKQERDDADQEA